MMETWQSSIPMSMYCPSPERSRSSSALWIATVAKSAGGDVADARAGTHGTASGLARDAQHPAHPLHDDVERRALGVRPRLTEA